MDTFADLAPYEPRSAAPPPPPRLVLVGNPNVGKSLIFGFLTGRYVTVSNYPGTTVALSRGRARTVDPELEVIDTPGINSLVPLSEDERVTRDVLLERAGQRVLQIADARNLRRALLVSVQLAEMGIPFALDLNMMDEAEQAGVRVDHARLAATLGVPVARTVAVRRQGFRGLLEALHDSARSSLDVRYPDTLEEAVARMAPLLPECHVSRRGLALALLGGDRGIGERIAERSSRATLDALEAIARDAAATLGESTGVVVNRCRLRCIDAILTTVETRPTQRAGLLAERLGALSTHPFWGWPLLLAVLFAVYEFVGVFGAGTAVDFFEGTVFGEYVSPWLIRAADAVLPFPHSHALDGDVPLPDYALGAALDGWQPAARTLHDLLVGPYGQLTTALSYAIALILPIVATFFIAFGLLEDSGYLPRLAVMVNRVFRIMGLNGKAVLPMVLGLGCDTMATLTARVLETRRERVLVTLLLALGVPCSAQLGVILAMVAALSPAATAVWAGSVLLTLLAVGWIAARVLPGEAPEFLLELPPIRMPQLGNVAIKTLARIEWYLREAVPLFLIGTLVLFVLDALALLRALEAAAAPLVRGVLGLPEQAAQAFLVGFLRRDYGAAGLYDLARDGLMDPVQLVVSMVTITLFVPCIANLLIIVKERGARTAALIVAVIVPTAFAVGGALNQALRAFEVTL